MISDEFKEVVDMTSTEGVMALRLRNEERMKIAKEKLGEKWLLHPANSPTKPQFSIPAFLLWKKN